MARIIETTVYDVDELDEAGKARARDWYITEVVNNDGWWHQAVFDEFETICGILGITVRTVAVRRGRTDDRTTAQRCIWFSGFSSQGDGASFEGTWEYAPGCCRKIREHTANDQKLHAIADALTAAQKPNFYELNAVITHQGHYNHEYCMQVGVERAGESGEEATDGSLESVRFQLRELAHWLYRRLRAEYDAQTSHTAVDETLRANEWEFRANGCFVPV